MNKRNQDHVRRQEKSSRPAPASIEALNQQLAEKNMQLQEKDRIIEKLQIELQAKAIGRRIDDGFSVTIVMADSTEIVVTIGPKTSVAELKAHVTCHTGAPPDTIELVAGDDEQQQAALHNNRATMEECQITSETMLGCVIDNVDKRVTALKQYVRESTEDAIDDLMEEDHRKDSWSSSGFGYSYDRAERAKEREKQEEEHMQMYANLMRVNEEIIDKLSEADLAKYTEFLTIQKSTSKLPRRVDYATEVVSNGRGYEMDDFMARPRLCGFCWTLDGTFTMVGSKTYHIMWAAYFDVDLTTNH